MVATADVTGAAASAVSRDEGMVTVAHSVTTAAGAAASEDAVRVDAASVAVDRGEAVSR